MRIYRKNFLVALVVLAASFAALVGRLWYLQIVRGDDYERFSRTNRVRLLKLPAPRGRLLDRRGREIVGNRQSYDLYAVPDTVVDPQGLAMELGAITGIDPSLLQMRLERGMRRRRFSPVLLASDVSRDQLALVVSRGSSSLRGVEVRVNYVRSYPYGSLAAHLLGYVGRASQSDLRSNPRLDVDDVVGKAGIERMFERYLRGRDGFEQVAIDALGRRVRDTLFARDLVRVEGRPGADVVLTLDMELERAARRALADRRGAVVVMDVRTGEVLAMVSNPSYDPGLFAAGMDPRTWYSLSSDRSFPLLNRSTQGIYPPGSVFKIVTALAALEEGVISPETVFYCPGYYTVAGHRYGCWRSGGHGLTDLHKALVESCDVYFYNVIERLGIDRLAPYMRLFGFGVPTGIGLAEARGVAPDRRWKLRVVGSPWYFGDSVTTAIGQGYVVATPLQVAVMTAAVANGGNVMRPIIVKQVVDRGGVVVERFRPVVRQRLPFSPEHLDVVRRALEGVVNEPNGTGRLARLDGVVVAGKTGTAQVVSMDAAASGRGRRDHAWFAAYAPADDPEVAVVVLVEHGGGGGSVAAPVAREVLRAYFDSAREGNS